MAAASLASQLVGHFLELGVLQDQVDHLPLDDLVAEHVHRAALLQPGPDPPRRLAALLGDQPDLVFVILLVRVDLLVLGDPLEDEVLLQRPGRGDAAVLPQLVFVGADLVVAEAAAAAAPSPPAAIRGWLCRCSSPGGRSQSAATVKRGGDLLAGPLLLLVFQLPAQACP